MMCLNISITCSFEKAGISDSAVLKGTVKLFMFQHVIVGENGYTFCKSRHCLSLSLAAPITSVGHCFISFLSQVVGPNASYRNYRLRR